MNENWTKFIELYLQGELSPEDTAKLETELQRNPELQQSLALQKQIHEAAKRSGDRQIIKGIRKQYQLQKTIKTSIMAVITAAAIATVSYFVIQNQQSKESNTEVSTEQAVVGKYEQLNDRAELENLPIAYFEHNGNDASYLSPKGILLSVPEKTFLLDGKTYDGKAVIQFQEALDASDIVKAGLSTTSGDRLLETQGMFGLKAFTPDGKELTINNKNGIYLQIPVDENKKGMMLFNGVKTADGSIDWQNPKPIEKLPIQANMLDLDLYPPGYETKLDEVKWSQKKEKRDSLYLSFEEEESIKDTTELVSKIQIRPKDILGGGTSGTSEETAPRNRLVHNTAKFLVILENDKTSIKSKMMNRDSIVQNYITRNFCCGTPTINLAKISQDRFQLTVAYMQDSDISDDPRKLSNDFEAINKNAVTTQEDHFGFKIISGDATIRHEKTVKRVNDRVPYYESTYLIETPKYYKKEIMMEAKSISRLIFAGGNQYFNIKFRNASKQTENDKVGQKNQIPPSKVLAIWKKELNNTILATRDFEKRMKAIHGTCNEKVFDVYANQLNKPLWQLDEEVVKMGYANFQAFADERVGGVRLDNAHMNTIRQFYESNVARLKEQAKKDKYFKKALEMAWDRKVRNERNQEGTRSAARNQQVLKGELNLNLENVLKQLGKTKSVGITIYGGSVTGSKKQINTGLYNIDRFVMETTLARKSNSFYDPETGKTAKITYNPFSASIRDAKEYGKLFMYLLPHELSSFQRINPVNGAFDYSLNAAIQYDVLFVGINDQGYFLYERIDIIGKKNVSSNLGEIKLQSVSEKEFERTIEKLSKDRQKLSTKSSDMSNEISWLKLERQDYEVQKLRQKNAEFRRMLQNIVFPCATESNYYFYQNQQDSDDENPFF